MLHRNSQKRIYAKDKIYSITMVVKKRLPFFQEEIFCQILFNVIKICGKFHEFELYGIVVIFDHVHLLVKPISCDISKLIGFLKRHTSRNINEIIKFSFNKIYDQGRNIKEGEHGHARLHEKYARLQIKEQKRDIKWMGEKMKDYKYIYQKKYPDTFHLKFKWQKSFHDHIIRDPSDFYEQLGYIRKNPTKHKLVKSLDDWPWLYANK